MPRGLQEELRGPLEAGWNVAGGGEGQNHLDVAIGQGRKIGEREELEPEVALGIGARRRELRPPVVAREAELESRTGEVTNRRRSSMPRGRKAQARVCS